MFAVMPAVVGRCAAVFLSVLLLSCTPADPIQRFSGPAQGATYNISYWSEQAVSADGLAAAGGG